MNMQGGSGYEHWQYLERTPVDPPRQIEVGDRGIFSAFVKSRDIHQSYQRLQQRGEKIVTPIQLEPDQAKSFHLKDPFGNVLRIKEFNSWYTKSGHDTGGVFGCLIGVSDIDRSLALYAGVLGYDKVLYDRSGQFEDLWELPGGRRNFRRVLLTHSAQRVGGFSKLLGDSQIELIQCLDESTPHIFANRYWGDTGFIHLCFDIRNMKKLTAECAEKGFPFKVLSDGAFDMGDTQGHWGYLEDADGTLIEFVETHKVPLLKSIGLGIDLTKRDPLKPLPNWMIKAMSLKRVRGGKK
ncbi:MAG: VOC family protein [Saprospiraceae bacterium]